MLLGEDAAQKIEYKNLFEINETEKSNLIGFFALLIKVDKRVNPSLYKNTESGKLLI